MGCLKSIKLCPNNVRVPLSKREYGSSQYRCALKRDKLLLNFCHPKTCIELQLMGVACQFVEVVVVGCSGWRKGRGLTPGARDGNRSAEYTLE